MRALRPAYAWPLASAAVALFTWSAMTQAHAESPSLKVAQRLLHTLHDATAAPALPTKPLTRCLRDDKPPAPNPYSPLPSPLAAHHQRLTTTGPQYAQVELRDAVILPTPQTLTFNVKQARDARLSLGLRLLPCGTRATAATLSVRVGDRAIVYPITEAPADARSVWREVTHALPEAADGDITVTLTLASPTMDAAVALADPVVLAASDDTRNTNVLLIIIDAVRGDVLGPATQLKTSITPALDRIFTEGVGFTQAFSASNQTRPSTVALLASLPPSLGEFHARSFALAPWFKRRFYETDPPLLTRALADAGWRVETIGHNHFQWDALPIGLDHGWDRAIDFRRAPEDTPLITDEAIRFLDDHADERWFLAVNYTAPHTPYTPPEAALDRVTALLGEAVPKSGDLPRSYLGELAWVDEHAGRMLDALAARGLDKRTLVIVTADHGEVMAHHHHCQSGVFQMPCHFSHGLTLYDEELHVPLGMRLPGHLAPGAVITRPISHLDVAPTVLALLGLPPQPGHAGRSWLSALLASADAAAVAAVDASPIYAEGRISVALRDGGKKLIVHNRDDDIQPYARTQRWSKEGPIPRHEVFDVAADPEERVNLAAVDKTVAEPLLARLDAVRAELTTRRDTVPDPSPDVADPAASKPRLVQRTPAWNVLRLTADAKAHALSVRLSVDGEARCRGVSAQASCAVIDASTLVVTLATLANGDPASASLETTPWDAAVALDMVLDDAPYPTARLRLGPYGLALLAPGAGLDATTWPLATGRHPPHIGPGPAAVYLWRAPLGQDQPVARPEDAVGGTDVDSSLDGEVRRMLEELGYVK